MKRAAAINDHTRSALVYNPRAGGLRAAAGRTPADFDELLDTLPCAVATCAATDRSKVDKFVVEAAERHVVWLIVAGGDGTLFSVLNGLFRSVAPERWPVVSVLPTGSTNALASLTGQPKPEQILPLLANELPDVGRLPRLSVRLLKVGDRVCVLSCAGYFLRFVSAYADGAPRYIGPVSWTVLRVLGIGAGVHFPKWLRGVDPVQLADGTGNDLRLPDGQLPGAVFCTADQRVAGLWRSYLGDDEGDGVNTVLAGERPEKAVREAVAARLMLTDTPREVVAESHPSITIESRTRLLLDGEFIYADAGARVEPGPILQVGDLRKLAA